MRGDCRPPKCTYDVSDEDAHLPEPCGRTPAMIYGASPEYGGRTRPLCAKHAKMMHEFDGDICSGEALEEAGD